MGSARSSTLELSMSCPVAAGVINIILRKIPDINVKWYSSLSAVGSAGIQHALSNRCEKGHHRSAKYPQYRSHLAELLSVQEVRIKDALSGSCRTVKLILREILAINLVSRRSRARKSSVCHPVAA